MITIEGKNLIEIKSRGYFDNVNYPVFLDLYTPIIGNDATVLYFYLINHINEKIVLDDLLIKIGLSLNGFKNTKKYLEATGLIDFLAKHNETGNEFKIIVYLFKTPKKFLNDIIFAELLRRNIGEEKVKQLINKYSIKKEEYSDFMDVSASFTDVYKEFTLNKNIVFDKNTNEVIFEVKGRTLLNEFDYDLFFEEIFNRARILKDAFSEEELKTINSLASMCQFNEEIMADFVIQAFNLYGKKGSKVDVKKLKNICFNAQQNEIINTKNSKKDSFVEGNTNIAKKVQLMETLTPVKYLKLKQNNVNPVNADLNIIYELKNNLGLNDAVINALIDYVLTTNNNVLNKTLVEKIGASLVREKVETAKDTMEYLLKTKKSKKVEQKVETKNETIENQESDEDFSEIYKIFEEENV